MIVLRATVNMHVNTMAGDTPFVYAWEHAPTKIYPDVDKQPSLYSCTCFCGNLFFGHKRDNTCPECEAKIPKQLELEL